MNDAVLAQWVGSMGTIFGVLFGLLGIWWQLKKQWLLNSANFISGLAIEFSSDTWIAHRKKSADKVKLHYENQAATLSRDIPILGFFENIGYMVRRGALDKEMVWNKFGWYVVRYYIGLTYKVDLIEQARTKEADKTLWMETEYLYIEMLNLYKNHGVTVIIADAIVTDQNKRIRIEELLEQELNLN
jgi:hypothetical protein